MKTYLKTIILWFVALTVLGGCSAEEPDTRISFSNLFKLMVETNYEFNLGIKGEDELLRLYPGEREYIEDYFIAKSEDAIVSYFYIFIEVQPNHKEDVKNVINSALKGWNPQFFIENNETLESPLLFEDDKILIYVYSSNIEHCISVINNELK